MPYIRGAVLEREPHWILRPKAISQGIIQPHINFSRLWLIAK